ncbi:MAG: ABC transporter substrate-binding protein [Chitinophagaceae bacterium]|nr:ABC transporter substrate-binding protein [Chitinophagaceae bacterium]
MKQVQDQTGNSFFIPSPPQRIISLVPSLTELLHSLELTDEVIGITKFCVHPDQWFRSKARIGGTKNVNVQFVKSLQPDFVIASKEENVKEQVEAIRSFCPVYCTDVVALEDSYQVIEQIGIITNRLIKARQLIKAVQQQFADLPLVQEPLNAAYLIWQEPYMTVGGDTFIHAMMKLAGFHNVFAAEKRYPQLTIAELQKLNIDVLLFSSEPFPFKQKHLDLFSDQWMQSGSLQTLPLLRIVDGEMFSWYGSRTLYAADYFRKLRESLFLSDEPTA